MNFVRLKQLICHYSVSGREQAPALVFINSLGTDLRIWDAVAAHFAERWRIVRYDQRGHGLSDAPPAPYTIAQLVGDLSELLDHLQLREAVLCGVSVGGMIAQGLAAARPERVRALVLCDTAARIGPAAMWDQRIEAIERDGLEPQADAIMERWFAPAFRRGQADQVAGWRNLLLRTPVAGYVGTCAAIRDGDLSAAAAAITVPTLVCCGAQDGATPPALVRSLAESIPASRFRLIDEAGHLPCVDQPAALAAQMSAFFEKHELYRGKPA